MYREIILFDVKSKIYSHIIVLLTKKLRSWIAFRQYFHLLHKERDLRSSKSVFWEWVGYPFQPTPSRYLPYLELKYRNYVTKYALAVKLCNLVRLGWETRKLRALDSSYVIYLCQT